MGGAARIVVSRVESGPFIPTNDPGDPPASTDTSHREPRLERHPDRVSRSSTLAIPDAVLCAGNLHRGSKAGGGTGSIGRAEGNTMASSEQGPGRTWEIAEPVTTTTHLSGLEGFPSGVSLINTDPDSINTWQVTINEGQRSTSGVSRVALWADGIAYRKSQLQISHWATRSFDSLPARFGAFQRWRCRHPARERMAWMAWPRF
jgi:hypothetical protein